MAKEVSPGVKALRKVVDDVHADARQAAKEGKLVGWSSYRAPSSPVSWPPPLI